MDKKDNFTWAVIGAGPAGIASIGNLLDSGVPSDEILWIDPHFQVGDLGTLWKNVSSNTSVSLFFDYFNFCESFEFKRAPQFEINQLNPNETCLLNYAVTPLEWITKVLSEKVNLLHAKVDQASMYDKHWKIQTNEGEECLAKNLILAVGATPRSLSYKETKEIPIEVGLDKEKLKEAVQGLSKVAVFGSSHSAVILIRDLLELGLAVDNYYLGALRYAVFFDDWVLFDDTGLKGKTAKWAREHLHGNLPKKLNRYLSSSENIEKHLGESDAAIYAVGFKRREFQIKGLPCDFSYNQHCGVIAPGVFGTGIGFPEHKIDRYGHHESSVGLWKFIDYIKRMMPLWQSYGL